MPPQSVLIVGGSGGLGSALVSRYAQLIGASNVFATTRSPPKPGSMPEGVQVISDIDVSKKDCADKIVDGLQGRAVQVVIYVSGILKGEVSAVVHQHDVRARLTGTGVWELKLGR
jgi:uncharacterized protein YbjT (DUF2867 family)